MSRPMHMPTLSRNETASTDASKSFCGTQAMDGRGRADDRADSHVRAIRNETASTDASKALVESQAMDGRGGAMRRDKTALASTGVAPPSGMMAKTMESACKPGPVRLAA